MLFIKSQNVRNLSNSAKILQETHTTTNTEFLYKKEWGGDIYFSDGTIATRGTCILFKKPNSDTKIHTSTYDDNGR